MKIKIKALIVDKKGLTMYLEDGSRNTEVLQGDKRLANIVAQAVPHLKATDDGKGGQWAIVDLAHEKEENAYENFEKKSGLIRFFKVAKEKLKELFAPTVPDISVGIPVDEKELENEATCKVIVTESPTSQTMDKIAEVIKHATPVSANDYTSKDVYKQGNIKDHGQERTSSSTHDSDTTHTVIAVVKTADGDKVIPEMERIESQFKNALQRNNPVGMENFLKRIAPVIERRRHSVQDLLKFVERNDMPIADDGCFIAYKALNNSTKEGGCFVDAHSGNVTQWLGSYVHMDENMVDPNRHADCSYGLHIARRSYLSGFTTHVVTLCKIAPEDVIAVPAADGNKIRVMGYHIVEVLTHEERKAVIANNTFTVKGDAALKLAKIVAGHHVGRTSIVKIGGSKGTNLTITRNLEAKEVTIPEGSLEKLNTLPDAIDHPVALSAPAVDVKEVLKVEAQAVETIKEGRKDTAKRLYADWESYPTTAKYDALKAFKKASKSSWESLGVPNPDDSAPTAPIAKEKPATVSFPKRVQVGKQAKQIAKPKFAGKNKLKETPVVAAKPETKKKDSPAIQMEELKKLPLDKDVAFQMLTIKKSSKKSWDYFGITKDRAELITLKGK